MIRFGTREVKVEVTSVQETVKKEEAKEISYVKGVWFEEDYLRVYPYNELACDTLGFTFSRDTADYGIEGYYNSSLTGIDGRQFSP